jgi:hypothetical protein
MTAPPLARQSKALKFGLLSGAELRCGIGGVPISAIAGAFQTRLRS